MIPLQKNTVKLLTAWLTELPSTPYGPLFPTSTGTPLNRAAVGKLVTRHAATAVERCPSLAGKNVTPHTLRHTCAMNLLHAGVDTSTIALWLGHANVRATQAYLHADLSLKEKALALTAPAESKGRHRYRPSDRLLTFLESL